MNNKEQRRYEQSLRQAKFPIDRIAFCRSAVSADNRDFNIYESDHHISLAWLCYRIADNNDLVDYFDDGKIPEGMMRNEMKLLGWRCRE